jgi:hypothetical protein
MHRVKTITRTGHFLRVLVVFAAVVALLASATAALAEIKVGTDGPETIVGTNSNDSITGDGGNDLLQGRAANDTYNFGDDTLTEPAFVKVGTKKLPGGTDTLSFSQVSGGPVDIRMIPQWAALGYNDVAAPNGESIELGDSRVENAVGGSGDDHISSGPAKNTYKGGPGGSDNITDYGGWDGDVPFPGLAASDDTYKGFTSGAGLDLLTDFGGTADKLDLRPLESSDVYFDAFDTDKLGSDDSLRIVISPDTSIQVMGHFAPQPGGGQENGTMEQIIFSDQVVTSGPQTRALMQ